MLSRLKKEFNVTFLFITHDRHWRNISPGMDASRSCIWGGSSKMVQRRLIADPRHPYTQALLVAVPEADPELTRRKRQIELRGADIPACSTCLRAAPSITLSYMVPGQCDVQPFTDSIAEGGRVACPIRKSEQIHLMV
jgi:ABC-type antimicrobial peptide transport system ATPase subunit